MRRLDEEEKDEKKSDSAEPELNQSPVAKALFKSRTVLIFGEIDMKLAERVTAQLLAHAAEGDGDIFPALADSLFDVCAYFCVDGQRLSARETRRQERTAPEDRRQETDRNKGDQFCIEFHRRASCPKPTAVATRNKNGP